MLVINKRLSIPDKEIWFTFSRSGGPGGQNVNKVSSKATLHWSISKSPSLPDDVRRRFLAKFKNRVTLEGELLLSSQRFRDQPKNVADCLAKLGLMLREVLQPPKPRRKTMPTRGSRERRLQSKRHRSAKLQARRGPDHGQ